MTAKGKKCLVLGLGRFVRVITSVQNNKKKTQIKANEALPNSEKRKYKDAQIYPDK